LRILLTCLGLACAATMLMISYAEKQQEAALDRLSSYELKSQSVLYDDPDVKQSRRAVLTCETSVERTGMDLGPSSFFARPRLS